MLETLMNLVQQQAGSAITSNTAIPSDKHQDAFQAVSGGILSGLQQQAQGGGLGNLIGMLTGNSGAQQEVNQGVQKTVQENLFQKLGISPQVAMSIAAAVVPIVLSKLSQKAQDPNDHSVNPNDVVGSITGKQGTDWMSMAQSAMADGKLDMSDLMRMMSGSNAQAQPKQQSGGGLSDMLGGLFGKS
ncbi:MULTISPECIES: DUF937 domain-containing protein [Spirosoma]|uniref:DUF937 domain-containing protein n=1 Tax=Spirosoma liriopis TaxID=2937440 RepID=A0ABT0HPF2_9BACT|nr:MULTISPECIES: DUF937 domain-containing protein [Spirosoma]MCK8494058.1 DUF937 domain-containing protein [Spirosoma liriopis]UHG89074.1 DUF937 domain-containing protein [Spirosoma oryzicola]